jgi:alpha-L-fucosidase 2
MPLQGVWTADDGKLPPWKGDYHHDLNTQMSYWHYSKANHMEEGESFIDFLWSLVSEARNFARIFYDAPGLCLPSVMSLHGKPLGGWTMYVYSLTNQIWLSLAFEKHWLYSGDVKFLRDRTYPYMKETASCVLRWLEPDKDGKLLLPLSSSPEIHDNKAEAWLLPNSNYDLALLRYFFRALSEMAAILNNGDEKVWIEKLKSLDDLAIGQDGALMLSRQETLCESHRHHSHALAIYPLKLLKCRDSCEHKSIIDATVKQLELLGKGQWVGYSFPWIAEFYAVQGNGDAAAYHLRLFWECFCSQNGFHLNGDYKKRGISHFQYRPFTLEGNMCAADALQEMLLQMDGNVIRVFPAIPEEWKAESISFSKLRGINGILVSSSMEKGRVVYIRLEASHKCTCRIWNVFASTDVIIHRNGTTDRYICRPGETIDLELLEKEICIIQNIN